MWYNLWNSASLDFKGHRGKGGTRLSEASSGGRLLPSPRTNVSPWPLPNLCGEWSFTALAALICDHPNQVISLHTQLFAQLWGCRGEEPCSVGKPSNCPFMGFRCWSTASIFSRCRDAGVLRNWVHCAYHWQIASCMPMFKLRSGLSICGYEDKLYIQ